MSTLKNEPVIVAVLAWVTATIALVVAFGVHVTPEQREAIEAWVGVSLTLGVLVRSRVVPLLRHTEAQPAPEHVEKAKAILASFQDAAAVPPVQAPAPAPATVIADAPVRL